jgi:hypothetical protein
MKWYSVLKEKIGKKRKLIWITLLLLGLLYTCTKVFPPPGFCPAKFRFPTDEEYIVSLLERPFKQGDMRIAKGDTTALAYYKNHSDCCLVTRDIRNLMWGFSIFDTDAINVEISYSLTQIAEIPNGGDGYAETEEVISKIYTVNGCGEEIGNPSTFTERKQ